MDNFKRTDPDHTDPQRRDRRHPEDSHPAHEGDVLGISDTPVDVEIPRATQDRGGHPQGIDVRTPATGIGDLHRGSGATGIDMGYAGEGTQITSHPRRPAAGTDADDDNLPE